MLRESFLTSLFLSNALWKKFLSYFFSSKSLKNVVTNLDSPCPREKQAEEVFGLVKNIILREISTEKSPVSVYRAWGWAGWWVQESPHNYGQGVTQRGSNQRSNHWKTGVERGGRS